MYETLIACLNAYICFALQELLTYFDNSFCGSSSFPYLCKKTVAAYAYKMNYIIGDKTCVR